METTTKISNSYSLLAFARTYGKMQIARNLTNKETGEQFDSCVFTDIEGNRVFVAFSSKLGSMSAADIAAQKDKLQVVQMEESGNYILCRQGENSWEDVEL